MTERRHETGAAEERRDPLGRWGLPIRFVIVVGLALLAVWLVATLVSVVLQVVIAIILASGMAPLVRRLQEMGVPRAVSVLVTYAVFIAALVLFGILVVPPLVSELSTFAANAPQYAEAVASRLRDLQARFPFIPAPEAPLEQQLRGLTSQLGAVAGQALNVFGFVVGALGGVLAAVFVLLLALYFVVYSTEIRDYLLSFVDAGRRPRIRQVTDQMGQRMGRWVVGQLVLSTAVGAIVFVGLTVIGVPGALVLAVLAGIGEVIPILGPWLAAIPAVIVAFVQSPTEGIITLVFYVALQQLESYLLAPKIVGHAVKLNPLVVLIALIAGAGLLGVVGALVAVPLTAALAVLLDQLRDQPSPDRDERPAEG